MAEMSEAVTTLALNANGVEYRRINQSLIQDGARAANVYTFIRCICSMLDANADQSLVWLIKLHACARILTFTCTPNWLGPASHLSIVQLEINMNIDRSPARAYAHVRRPRTQ